MKKRIILALAFILSAALPALSLTKAVTINGSHGALSAVIQTPDGLEKYPAVIICHGFMGEKNYSLLTNLADYLEADGIASIRFDFNGHGESEGRFQDMTVINELEDAEKVFDYVRALPEVTTIAIAGHSQGGVVASMTAGNLADKIQCAVLFAPAAVLRDDAIRGSVFGSTFNALNPPEFVEIMGHRVGRDYFLTARDLPIYETAAEFHSQACIIHGTGDTIVPYTYGLRYHEIWKDSEIHIIPEWDHGFTGHEEEAAKIAADFLARTLK